MNTKSKYSPYTRYYYVRDTNNLYWQKNISYGYNFQNQAVFEARFVDKLSDATGVTWDEADEVVGRFKDPHIVGGSWKADTTNLLVERFPELLTEEDMKLFK